MISAEQIQSNWVKFLKTIEVEISSPRKEKLLEFYNKFEDRFILMPASHKPQYHNCYPGGYIDHVNRVVDLTKELVNVWLKFGTLQTFTKEEAIFSALNHDLGKFGTLEEPAYLEQTDQWRKDKLGELYMFNSSLEYMTVPDRSLFLLNSQGIEVTKNELLAIKLHDGLYEESNKSYLFNWLPEQKPRTSLVHIIHQADFIASNIEFEKEWSSKLNIKEIQNNLDNKKSDITIPSKKKSDLLDVLKELK